jgi:hypothetical protein
LPGASPAVPSPACLVATGDLIAQKAIEKNRYSFRRGFRAFVLGFSVIGFNLYAWYYKVLPFLFQRVLPVGASQYPALATTVLDQLIFAPYLTVPVMYAYSYFEVCSAVF